MGQPIVSATYADYRLQARRFLPRQLFDYIDGGSFQELTLQNNTLDLNRICIRQRVARNVSRISTSTRILGQDWSMPVALAPVGMAGLFRRRGEAQAARAAVSFGVPFSLSAMGLCSIEEVAEATKTPFWFQLYMMRDREYLKELIGRAENRGCSALVVTVDFPYAGARYRTGSGEKSGVTIDRMKKLAWLRDVVVCGRPLVPFTDFIKFAHQNFDPSVTWKDIDWLRAQWKGPLIIKGVLEADDALMAVDVGAEAIVVSNHGGRQLDSVSSSIRALPSVVDAVGGRLDVLLDGGIRSGIDVFKAVALGAKGCLLGRAWAFSLAAGGEAGVKRMLWTMHNEFRVAMALTGVTAVAEINQKVLGPVESWQGR